MIESVLVKVEERRKFIKEGIKSRVDEFKERVKKYSEEELDEHDGPSIDVRDKRLGEKIKAEAERRKKRRWW
jgi:hypothetical protein